MLQIPTEAQREVLVLWIACVSVHDTTEGSMAGLSPYQQAISWIIYLHMRFNSFNAKFRVFLGYPTLHPPYWYKIHRHEPASLKGSWEMGRGVLEEQWTPDWMRIKCVVYPQACSFPQAAVKGGLPELWFPIIPIIPHSWHDTHGIKSLNIRVLKTGLLLLCTVKGNLEWAHQHLMESPANSV